MIDFGRDICGDLANAERREWLVTNGIGGFASGTVAGLLTRRYHGLLVAALQPPVGRTLLASKADESVTYAGQDHSLRANRWVGGVLESEGYLHLERFHLEGTTPVWTFSLADALLEKRVWMQPGANTTYVQYYLQRATAPMTLVAKALVNYRDYHGETRANGWQMRVEPVAHGLQVVAYDGAIPFYLLSDSAEARPQHEWYRRYFLLREANRGLGAVDDNLYAGQFRATIQPGESLTLVFSTSATPDLDGMAALAERHAYEQELLAMAGRSRGAEERGSGGEILPSLQQLILAADQFIVRRPLPDDPDGRSLIAGYHWFGDWGRDTMIALPGLTLATGRPEVATKILRTFAHFVDQGMLPNRFPDAGETPEYNTVDATLWYFEAVRATHAATGDDQLVCDLFPVLQDIVDWHQRGTRYNIHVDPADSLLYAGEPGVQLTWMDAKVGDWVVTPRQGKAVEVNALWYNALCIMADFARLLEQGSDSSLPAYYREMAERVREGFARFWNAERGYCYDVLDTPAGDDATLRPNQLLAVSLPHSPLPAEQQKAVVDVCAQHLLTSHGLRSLSPDHPAYIGRYGGDPRQRDGAYHQGTVWAWLIGPFVQAHYRVYGDGERARSFLHPLLHHLADHGLGSISEIFDGDPPFTPRGCIAQAWSVAEILRTWQQAAW